MRSFPFLRNTIKDRARQRGFNSTADMALTATSSIALPTDSDYSSVVSLVRCRGTDGSTTFTDDKGKTWTTASPSKIITTLPNRWDDGGGVARFNGSGGINTPNHSDFNFPGDFTVEATVMTFSPSSQMALVSNYQGATAGWSLQTYLSKFVVTLTGDGVDLNGSTTIQDSVWYHVAVTRSGSTCRLFVNGALEASVTDSTSLTSTSKCWIGRFGDGYAGGWLNGLLHDVRITKGVARYTAAFTPPTGTFPTN